MSEVDKAWARMRVLLEEVAVIAESLSEKDAREVETLMDSWMQDNQLE